MNNESSFLVRFSNFSEDFRQTNCCVPLRIDRPSTHSGHSFAEETGGHMLRNASSTNNIRLIWLVFEHPHGGLFFFFGRIRKDP